MYRTFSAKKLVQNYFKSPGHTISHTRTLNSVVFTDTVTRIELKNGAGD